MRSYKYKIENILNRIINLLLGSCPRCGTWGAGWVKNLSVGICDGAPSTAHSSLSFVFFFSYFLSFSFLLLFLSFSVVMSRFDYFIHFLALYLILMDSFLCFDIFKQVCYLAKCFDNTCKHTSMLN